MRPRLLTLALTAVMFGACGSDGGASPDSRAQLPATTTTTTTTIVVPQELALSDETTTTMASQLPVLPAAEITRAEDVCAALNGFYEHRVALRASFLTSTDDENLAALDAMREQLHGVPPTFFPYFDWTQTYSLMAVERVLPERLARGGAIWREDIEENEADAEQIHQFTREFCPGIDASLFDVGPVLELAEAVYELEEQRRFVDYCAAAEQVVGLRHTVLQALDRGQFDGDARDAYGAFLAEFQEVNFLPDDVNAAYVIEENGPFLEFASDRDYERRLYALMWTVADARLALTTPSVPVIDSWDVDANDRYATELLESFASLCPELPADQLTHTPLSDRGVRSVALTTDTFSDATPALDEVCRDIDLMLSLYAAATQAVASADGANEAHWRDIQMFGARIFGRSYSFEDSVVDTFGWGAGSAAGAPNDVGKALYDGEAFGSDTNDYVMENIEALAELAADECTGIPAELLSPPTDFFEHLADRIAERPAAE